MAMKRARQKAAAPPLPRSEGRVTAKKKASRKPKTTAAARHEGDSTAKTAATGAQSTQLGRNTLLTDDLRDRIAAAIRGGAYNETAAAHAGISERTFYNWLTRAQEDRDKGIEPENSPHLQFLQAIEKAQADAEIESLLIIRNSARGRPTTEGVPGAPGQWQAAAWYLERKHPDRYGRRIVTIPDPDPEDPRKKGKPAAKKQYFRFGGQVLEI